MKAQRVARAIALGTFSLIGVHMPASTPQATAIHTMQKDLADRSPAIHWPSNFNPLNADLFAHNELLIQAPCEKVFSRIVDVTKWPQWYPNSADIHVVQGGPELQLGSRFLWTTFGLHIESEVHEFVPNQRIGWYGYVPGQTPAFYHTWLLSPLKGGCMTVMEEAGKGASPAHLRQTDESLMHRGHDLWLQTLRWVSESQGG